MLVAEGIQVDEEYGGEDGIKIFPEGAREEDAQIRLIIDPIDGTRGIMYGTRPGWALAGVAPNKGRQTRLRDVEVAVKVFPDGVEVPQRRGRGRAEQPDAPV